MIVPSIVTKKYKLIEKKYSRNNLLEMTPQNMYDGEKWVAGNFKTNNVKVITPKI